MSSVFKRLHFLKLERATRKPKDVVKYTIKNHFDVPIVSVEEKEYQTKDEKDADLEYYDVIDLQARKAKSNEDVLFQMAVASQCNNANEDQDFNTCVLTMTSKSGETMGRVIAVKDMGLSTSIYQLVDNENEVLYQVHRKLCNGEYELHVKSVNDDERVIARIKMDDAIISLSMAPELDLTAKMRLICLMMFQTKNNVA